MLIYSYRDGCGEHTLYLTYQEQCLRFRRRRVDIDSEEVMAL